MVIHQDPGQPPTDEDLRIFFTLQSDQAIEHRRCSTVHGPCAHRRAAIKHIDVVLDTWLTRHPSSAPAHLVSANVSDETV